ncbi:FAD-dependent monooxygenase [Gemmobacter sp.]|uniref:FAD-dependent monooxygenase n=1 Tax=Gemmobacter sp. TaxID=1898957 RepID=UPI002B0032D0|nr:FAD-dependent monooxygenase [Gemmobacter sp.]
MSLNRLHADVVIVGAGPTGLTLANFLGGMGVSVLLVERNLTTVQEPRAISIDDESMRTMQAIGLHHEVGKIVASGYGSHYYSPAQQRFLTVEPTSRDYGFDKRNAFQQPDLEQVLRDGLSRHASVRQMFGWEFQAPRPDRRRCGRHNRQPSHRPGARRQRAISGRL